MAATPSQPAEGAPFSYSGHYVRHALAALLRGGTFIAVRDWRWKCRVSLTNPTKRARATGLTRGAAAATGQASAGYLAADWTARARSPARSICSNCSGVV